MLAPILPKRFLVPFACWILTFIITSVGQGQTVRDWNNTTGLDAWYQMDTNWSDDDAPSSTEKARFNQASTYEVWWDATTASTKPAVGYFEVLQGDVTFLNQDTATLHLYTINGSGDDGDFSDFSISGASNAATISGLHFKSLGGGQIVNGGTLTLDGSHAMGSQLTVAGAKGFDVSGNLNINSAAIFENSKGYIAYQAGSTGMATVTGSGSQWNNTQNLIIGWRGNGTLSVEAGGVVASNNGDIGSKSNGSGNVTVSGSGSQWSITKNLTIGRSGNGTLNIEAGGVVTSKNGNLGSLSKGSGNVIVTGNGSQWSITRNLRVGQSGEGTLNVEAGAIVSNRDGYIAHDTLSTGTATVTGSGSQWNISRGFYIGGSADAVGGSGTLTVSDSGLVDVAGTTKLWSTGTLTLDGGSLTTESLDNTEAGTFNFNTGTLEITDSAQSLTISASNFSFTNGTTFNTDAGTTTLGTDEHLNIAGAATIASGATLTLSGGSLTSGSFTNNGTIHTTSGTSSISGDMQVNGTVQVETGSELVLGDQVTGAGTFAGGGEVTFQGNLRPGNSPGTIQFGGDVTLDASSITFIELAGLTDAEFDRLLLNNSDATLTIASGAQVDVQLIDGFTLGYNQEFVFADVAGSNAVAGTFNGLGEGDLVGNYGGFDLFISYNAGTGNNIAFFTSVPEPGALMMFGLVVGIGGMGRRRRRV